MIGLIAPNLSSTRLWRDQTKVPEAISPWLQDVRMFSGLRLTAIICLPSWEERPGNGRLLQIAQANLFNATPDPADVEVERSTPVTGDGNPAHAIEPPPERSIIDTAPVPFDSVVPERWNPAPRPSLGDEDDRSVARRWTAEALYDAMTPDERGHLMGLIRAPSPNPRDISQYVETMRLRYADSARNAVVGDQLRANHINQLVEYMGESDRPFLESLAASERLTLLRAVQEIRLLERVPGRGEEMAAAAGRLVRLLDEYRHRVLMRADVARTFEGVPTQRVTRPPTSGPATGGRAVGRRIPFADIFAPQRRRLREDDL